MNDFASFRYSEFPVLVFLCIGQFFGFIADGEFTGVQ